MGFSAGAATVAGIAFGPVAAAGVLALSAAKKAPKAPKPIPPRNEPKAPNVAALGAANAAQNAKGLGSTYLTGASGVDPSTLNLGGTTLLGA